MERIGLNKGVIMLLADCSISTANEILYYNLFSNKIYLNRKNNSRSTILWLRKKFDISVSEIKNDAPRGGKTGDFVTFEPNVKFEIIRNSIISENEKFVNKAKNLKFEQQAKINAMVISENEAIKFLEKTKDLSNKKSRTVAHCFAGRKLGFFSNEAKDKFMNLRK